MNIDKKNSYFETTESISACIIVKNEQKKIKRCISSLELCVDEIIVVDTGSSDDTLKILEQMRSNKIKIYSKIWENDFSSIRNFSLSKASKKWILIIDADETIISDNLINFKRYLSQMEKIKNDKTILLCPEIYDHFGNILDNIPRVFLKCNNTKFQGRCHEKIISNNEITYIKCELSIYHDGYDFQNIDRMKKVKRNTKLLLMDIHECPENKRNIYFLTRDSIGYLPSEYLINLLLKTILIDKKKNITKENILIDQYTEGLLINYVKILIFEQLYNKSSIICEVMLELFPNNGEVLIFYLMSIIFEEKQKLNSFLVKVTDSNLDVNLQKKLLSIIFFETFNYGECLNVLSTIEENSEVPDIWRFYQNEVFEIFSKKDKNNEKEI